MKEAVYTLRMTIVFTGGGSGGHFYPIIAIAEAMQDLVREKRLLAPKLYYLAPTPFDEKALFENGITYISTPAGENASLCFIPKCYRFFHHSPWDTVCDCYALSSVSGRRDE